MCLFFHWSECDALSPGHMFFCSLNVCRKGTKVVFIVVKGCCAAVEVVRKVRE